MTDSINDLFYGTEEAEPELPTEEAVTEEAPEEDTEEPVEGEDIEESEGEEGTEEADDIEEDADSFIIDDVEHNLNDVKEWKQAHDNVKLMQADCTKKWQEAADLKKSAEAEATKNQELTLELEALLAEDDEESLEDLKEYDEAAYYKRLNKIEKRKAKVKELKVNQSQQLDMSPEQLQAESVDFLQYDAKWLKDGQPTEQFNTDMAEAGKYLAKVGFSNDEISRISQSKQWKVIIDASRNSKKQEKVSSIKKKVRSAPKATKPKATTAKPKSREDVFYGN